MSTNDQNTTVIGPDAHIKGEMSFSGSAKILGTFEGSITSQGEISVGEGATCNAEVHASRVVVDGTVNGDVRGDALIELNDGANVTGDITAGNLVVVEGASFVGHCRVGPGAGTAKASADKRAESKQEVKTSVPAAEASRPRVETRSMRPASAASETAASPSAATAAVARATSAAASNTSWLRTEDKGKDDQAA